MYTRALESLLPWQRETTHDDRAHDRVYREFGWGIFGSAMSALADTTYVLPIRHTEIAAGDDLPAYLASLIRIVPVVIVDGSPPNIFAEHALRWPRGIVHIPVDADRRDDLNGKVAGVVTGLRRVRTPKAIVADEDVRYDRFTLRAVASLLDGAGVVRPQNVFDPLPWHALLDSGRTLIARATGGDWPGTLGLRLDAFARAGNEYDGNVLFENLELVRTLRAGGAREILADDVFVARRPPTGRHYAAQRIRQAYDEFARPHRLAAQLAIGPCVALAANRFGIGAIAASILASIALAEAGRRRGSGRRAFPPQAAVLAPVWVAERAVTAWIALGLRFVHGGVRYSRGTLRTAANPHSRLRARLDARRALTLEAVAQ